MPRLAICIPTYNFGQYIGATLNSIIPQLSDDCEIVILDGGSIDETEAVVRAAQVRCKRISYHQREQPGGIDGDMARVVALAEADHCWLFSADDLMIPGAIDRVLAATAEGCDVVLVSHSDCTLDMKEIAPVHPVLRGDSRSFEVTNPNEREAYFQGAETSEAFFSFMSGLVVRRACWQPDQPAAIFHERSCWSHAARLLTRMRDDGLRIAFIAEPLVARRGDNDSFRSAGLVARIALAIDGYTRIVADIFGPDSRELVHLRRVLRAEFKFGLLFHAKGVAARDRHTRTELYRLASVIWRDGMRQRLRVAVLRILPSRVAFALHRISMVSRGV